MHYHYPKTILQKSPAIMAAITMFIGACVVVLWHLRNEYIITHYHWVFHMKHTTALLFVMSSLGVFFIIKEKYKASLFTGGTILFLSTLFTTEYLLGINLFIAPLFIEDYIYSDTIFLGRPAPNTAIAFIGIGFAEVLLTLTPKKKNSLQTVFIQIAGIITFVLGAHALGGHIQSVENSYSWARGTQMSVHTAISNMLIGFSLLYLSWRNGYKPNSKVPIWLPALLCFFTLQIDLATSPGIMTSVIYIPLVFCGLWFNHFRAIFIFAAVASIFTILRYFTLPIEYLNTEILINRLLMIGTIWLVATMVYHQRQTDYRLQRGEKYLKTILDHTVNGLIVINSEGIIRNFNKASERIFGYTEKEVIGKNIKMLMPPPYKEGHDIYLQNYLKTREKRLIGVGREVSGLRKNRTTFPMDLSISEMTIEGKLYFSGIVTDITDRKTSEQKLLQTNTELERFVFVAAHDLQEPLRTITMYSDILEDQVSEHLDEKNTKYLNNIRNAAKHMRTLISDLLEYSRMSNESHKFEKTPIKSIIQMAIDNLIDTIERRNATLEIDKSMPEITGNPVQLVSLFQNLIGNALKYTDKDVEPHIELYAEKREHDWIFSIKDNGIGIEQQYVEQIFAPFKRLHTSDEYSGTGIGLSMCKRIVEQHGGQIWVSSPRQEGSIFYFTLPIK